MSEEFNIFKNLEELRETNLLDQLKSLVPSKTVDANDSLDLDNDDFDFESLVNNNNIKKSPTKRERRKSKTATPKKKTRENAKSRRSSSSTDGSISPTMPLLSKVEYDMPVGRRTRRSLEVCTKIPEIENEKPSSSMGRGRGKGRGRDRGRGRGRGRASLNSSLVDDMNISDSIEDTSENTSSTLTIMQSFLHQTSRGRSRVMRGRRQYVAERAARSTQVDFIDLVSSPLPRVEGVIELDSDSEVCGRITRSKKKNQEKFTFNACTRNGTANAAAALNISFDEDNPELNIKINWKGKPEAFKLRKYQKFSLIFKQFAERENISAESIVFNMNDRIIMADDTPDSINYKIFQFIDGRVLSNSFNSPASKVAAPKKREANKINLKIQTDKWKHPLQIDLMKTDKFRILYIKCAEELRVGIEHLKLSFDGDLLELNGTPSDLDLEGGEAIDLHINN